MTRTPQTERSPARDASHAPRWVQWLERERLTVAIPVLFGCLYLAILRNLLSQDGWLALLSGREIVHHGLPDADRLTVYARGVRWVDQQWLGQLAMYGETRVGGLALLALIHVALAMIVVGLAVAVARQGGAAPSAVAAVAATAFVPLSFVVATIRTEIFGAVAFAVVLALLVGDARRPSSRVWWTIPTLVVWANLHGSVLLGGGLVALRGLTLASAPATRRRGIGLAVAGGLGVLASPYLVHLPAYYRHTAFNHEFSRLVGEWHPATPSLATAPFYALIFLAVWARGRRPSALTTFEWLALLITGLAGMAAVRHAGCFALLALMTIPTVFEARWRPQAGRLSGLPVVVAPIALLVALAIIAALRCNDWFAAEFPKGPAQAVARIAASEPDARIFADVRFADWLLWRDPALAGRIAYDARYELLSASQLETIRNFNGQRGEGWAGAASGYRVVVLDEAADGPVARALLGRSGSWLAYGGPGATVVVLMV